MSPPSDIPSSPTPDPPAAGRAGVEGRAAVGDSAGVESGLELAGLAARRARSAPGTPHRGRVLFVQGMWEGAWFWDGYLRLFAGRGWDAWALDLRGHGESPLVPRGSKETERPLGRIPLSAYLADARRAAEALAGEPGGDGRRPALVGHSMGGLLVEKLAEEGRTPAVVALTPAAPRGFLAIRTWPLVKAVVRHLHQILLWRPLAPSLEEMKALELNCLPPAEQERVFARQQPESGRQAFDISVIGLPVDGRRITVPLLLAGASDDRITPASLVAKVARRLDAEYREYPGHAHMIAIEPGWREPATDIARWLEGWTQGRPGP